MWVALHMQALLACSYAQWIAISYNMNMYVGFIFHVLSRLKDTVEGFLELQSLPEFQELEHFPDDLLMCYVINTWKEIVLYQSQVDH